MPAALGVLVVAFTAVTLAALGAFTRAQRRAAVGYLRQIFEAFGPERSFWGTDITRMPCSYRQCVTMFTEELPWLGGRDLERVMGGAVVDWLGWNRPAAP
jgi:hypothetical protein